MKFDYNELTKEIKQDPVINLKRILNLPEVAYVENLASPYFNLTAAKLIDHNGKITGTAFLSSEGKLVTFKDINDKKYFNFTYQELPHNSLSPLRPVSFLRDESINGLVDQSGNLYINKEFNALNSMISVRDFISAEDFEFTIENIDPQYLIEPTRLKTYTQAVLCGISNMVWVNYNLESMSNDYCKQCIKQIENAFNRKLEEVVELINKKEKDLA